MSLTATVYRSTDPGAPSLSGTAGSLTAFLDAILVDGYGSGADVKPGLGWTRQFSGTNKRVYQNNPTSGSGFLLRIDDSATVGNARHAWATCYESMSDIDTGAGQHPLPSDYPNGSLIPKSNVLSSAPRAWRAIGNERCLYLFIDVGVQGIDYALPHFFGDIVSFKPGDACHSAVSSNELTAYAGASILQNFFRANDVVTNSTVTKCLALGRNYRADPGSIYVTHNTEMGTAQFGNNASSPFPNPVNYGLWYSSIRVKEGAYLLRGRLPGVLAPEHARPFDDDLILDNLPGHPLPGTRLLAWKFSVHTASKSTAYNGQVLFDTVNEWW
ncbi:hypothetical protein [Luteimonas notoginsengisoli]|uniref:Uncharacterized protein n=1 Tax=Luteimonas notoginsengisoli TaxID=1578200 RepID=A0ABV7UQ36_9GAMM